MACCQVGIKPLSKPMMTQAADTFRQHLLVKKIKLEQLERLRSEIPSATMITHTRDSHQIPSQNKTKSKLQI